MPENIICADLKKTYIIFICLQDPLNAGLPVYHIDSVGREDSRIEFKDEAAKILVNAEGSTDGLSPEMAAFFHYLKSNKAKSRFTEQLDNEVERAKAHIEWRTDYMSLLEKFEIEREEGREEGHEARGLENARAMLADNMDISLVVKYSGLTESQVLSLKESMAEYSVH